MAQIMADISFLLCHACLHMLLINKWSTWSQTQSLLFSTARPEIEINVLIKLFNLILILVGPLQAA